MFCKMCGTQLNELQAICISCGVKVGDGTKFCAYCGVEINPDAAVCLSCGCPASSGQYIKKALGFLQIKINLQQYYSHFS